MSRRTSLVTASLVLVLACVSVFLFRISKIKQQSLSERLPPSVDTTSSETQEANWNTYQNTKYGFVLKYPRDFYLVTDVGPLEQTISQPRWQDDTDEIMIYQSSSTSRHYLDVTGHERSSTSTDQYEDPVGFWSGPIATLIPKIRTLAETAQDEPNGPVRNISLATETAYEFTVNKGVGLNGFGEAIDEPYLWAFLGTKSAIIEVSFPNTPMFGQILQTVELTP
jgi:hypothetical protein